MPHIIPCPAPRVKFADSELEVLEDGSRRRRRRTTEGADGGGVGIDEEKQMRLYVSEEEKAVMRKRAHECPVPKPPGAIGRVLGFKNEEDAAEQSRSRTESQETSKVREDDV